MQIPNPLKIMLSSREISQALVQAFQNPKNHQMVDVVGYVMLCGVDGPFLRIVPEMLGFYSDRSSRVHTSTKIFGKLLGK